MTVLRGVQLFGKPLLVPALTARFLAAPRAPGSRQVLVAHACCWAGDLALNGRTRAWFLTGLSSFLTAHVAYISACRCRSSTSLLATSGRRGLLLAGVGASMAMARAAGRQDRTLIVPVAMYGATLSTMLVAAAAVDQDRGRTRVLTGASLFVLSDTLIGVRKFVADDRGAALGAAVMATYVAAQWCIADGMASGSGAARG